MLLVEVVLLLVGTFASLTTMVQHSNINLATWLPLGLGETVYITTALTSTLYVAFESLQIPPSSSRLISGGQPSSAYEPVIDTGAHTVASTAVPTSHSQRHTTPTKSKMRYFFSSNPPITSPPAHLPVGDRSRTDYERSGSHRAHDDDSGYILVVDPYQKWRKWLSSWSMSKVIAAGTRLSLTRKTPTGSKRRTWTSNEMPTGRKSGAIALALAICVAISALLYRSRSRRARSRLSSRRKAKHTRQRQAPESVPSSNASAAEVSDESVSGGENRALALPYSVLRSFDKDPRNQAFDMSDETESVGPSSERHVEAPIAKRLTKTSPCKSISSSSGDSSFATCRESPERLDHGLSSSRLDRSELPKDCVKKIPARGSNGLKNSLHCPEDYKKEVAPGGPTEQKSQQPLTVHNVDDHPSLKSSPSSLFAAKTSTVLAIKETCHPAQSNAPKDAWDECFHSLEARPGSGLKDSIHAPGNSRHETSRPARINPRTSYLDGRPTTRACDFTTSSPALRPREVRPHQDRPARQETTGHDEVDREHGLMASMHAPVACRPRKCASYAEERVIDPSLSSSSEDASRSQSSMESLIVQAPLPEAIDLFSPISNTQSLGNSSGNEVHVAYRNGGRKRSASYTARGLPEVSWLAAVGQAGFSSLEDHSTKSVEGERVADATSNDDLPAPASVPRETSSYEDSACPPKPADVDSGGHHEETDHEFVYTGVDYVPAKSTDIHLTCDEEKSSSASVADRADSQCPTQEAAAQVQEQSPPAGIVAEENVWVPPVGLVGNAAHEPRSHAESVEGGEGDVEEIAADGRLETVAVSPSQARTLGIEAPLAIPDGATSMLAPAGNPVPSKEDGIHVHLEEKIMQEAPERTTTPAREDPVEPRSSSNAEGSLATPHPLSTLGVRMKSEPSPGDLLVDYFCSLETRGGSNASIWATADNAPTDSSEDAAVKDIENNGKVMAKDVVASSTTGGRSSLPNPAIPSAQAAAPSRSGGGSGKKTKGNRNGNTPRSGRKKNRGQGVDTDKSRREPVAQKSVEKSTPGSSSLGESRPEDSTGKDLRTTVTPPAGKDVGSKIPVRAGSRKRGGSRGSISKPTDGDGPCAESTPQGPGPRNRRRDSGKGKQSAPSGLTTSPPSTVAVSQKS
ncbi:hypothetical protein OE88DRAFT_1809958 [Heliocybe sulcata]|uniref:Proteophosphoglycan ppg4 n=1 Tax=Heliocybe sulcata TaxID=5364 RepID=A0A5C3MW53_9AGAM|nr:hypothetical protein OE88DRAFT_1809958 [Heliocybe sulcata]